MGLWNINCRVDNNWKYRNEGLNKVLTLTHPCNMGNKTPKFDPEDSL